MIISPDFVLFAQHGWADDSKAIASLARSLATPKTLIVAPDLGWIKTWIRIDPLIHKLEQIFLETLVRYPKTPIKIIGHSMGGLIWLEVLSRHPEWWSQVHSLVLIASPIGGADLARIFDPLGIGIGMARDLGINRREMAELIATAIPTLIIAGDIDNGSDGTITIETTKFSGAKQFICLPALSHAVLKNHPEVVATIQNFWTNPQILVDEREPDFSTLLIQQIRLVPGITDAHRRDFYRSRAYIRFHNGITIRTWRNPLQVEHVFIGNNEGQCLYGGFVGWLHADGLRRTLEDVKKQYHGLCSANVH
ncbi:alpha/beta hydrolase [Allocoleopsis sp.]|uniref:alpha/beta hydrolase n=1 Tax=Allocoleopsis sp. TaxID=3088169 RepID=UPI002FD01CDE